MKQATLSWRTRGMKVGAWTRRSEPFQAGSEISRTERNIRSALFVDFDNVYSGLQELDPNAAERFASDPSRWLRWIERGMPSSEETLSKDLLGQRVLIRRCYLNTVAYSRFRTFFTRSGLSVVDCPPLTRQGKTTTDIHMVMDILDTLQRYENITNFVILSGDADFTPV